MGSTMRNVLMGIAGGMQGYQQAAKLEMDKEEQTLKNKLLEFQQKKIQSDLTQSGLEYENQAKMRLAIGDELKQTGTVRPETMMRFLSASKDAPVIAELLKMSQAAQKPILKPATSSLITPQGKELAPATMTGRPAVEGSRSDIVSRLMQNPNDPVALEAMRITKEMATNPTGTEAITGSKILQENPGISSTDFVNKVQAAIRGLSGARTAGAVTGRMGVEGTPQFQGVQKDVAQAKAEGATAGKPLEASTQKDIAGLDTINDNIKVIRNNFNPDFLGPVKGLESAFEARRRIGGYIDAPVGKQEMLMRQSLMDVSDQLLRVRSGAQINEQEYQRMVKILPRSTDESDVFLTSLSRFETEMNKLLADKMRLGTTPRSKLGEKNQPSTTKKFSIPSNFEAVK